MSNFIEHAKREFELLGYTPLDQEQEEGPNKWIQENVLELLKVFSEQGHSGASAPFCLSYFEKLANFKPLSPLTYKDNEWLYHDTVYQNLRDSSVFKNSADGKPYRKG